MGYFHGSKMRFSCAFRLILCCSSKCFMLPKLKLSMISNSRTFNVERYLIPFSSDFMPEHDAHAATGKHRHLKSDLAQAQYCIDRKWLCHWWWCVCMCVLPLCFWFIAPVFSRAAIYRRKNDRGILQQPHFITQTSYRKPPARWIQPVNRKGLLPWLAVKSVNECAVIENLVNPALHCLLIVTQCQAEVLYICLCTAEVGWSVGFVLLGLQWV